MGVFSRIFGKRQAPVDSKAIERLVDHAAANVMRRALDAAETPSWTESWSTTTGSLNQDIERGLAIAVARCRDLTRNNDWGRGFMIRMRSNILGPRGMTLQVRMKRGEVADKPANDQVESFWAGWGKRGNCEVTGRLNWRQCERLMLDHWARDGEILVRLLPGRGPYGFQIQILDPLLLDITYRGTHGGNRVRLGVEIDDDDRPVAYWLRGNTDGDYLAAGHGVHRRVRVPAEDIIHHFITEEAGQLRGLPWLVAGARRLWLVRDYEQSAAVASSNAAKRVGFFVSPNPNGETPSGFADQVISAALDAAKASGKVLTPAEIQAITASAQKFSTVAPGQYDTLPQGYDFKAHDSQYPHINYGEYIKECIRGFSAGVGMSYVTAGNNLEAVNFSSARVGILDERELFKLLQEDFCESINERIFAHAFKYGLLTAPELGGFASRRKAEALAAATWQMRRWAGIDPAKEANANDTNLANRLTSPQRIMTERGDDPDEIAAEIRAWEAEFGPLGGNAIPEPPEEGEDASDGETRNRHRRAHLVRVRAYA